MRASEQDKLKEHRQSARYYSLGRQLGFDTKSLEDRWAQVTTKAEAAEVIKKQEALLAEKDEAGS